VETQCAIAIKGQKYVRIIFPTIVLLLLTGIPAVSAGAAQEAMTFVKWTDPTEQAFSVEVPKGWQVSGGVHWNGPTDAKGFLRAKSPDDKVQVFIDDPEILPRQVPHPAYAQLGYVEGRVIQSPAGPVMIQRFHTGSQFAQQYASQRLCKTPRWVKVDEMSSLSQSITNSILPEAQASGAIARASAGEASFQCNDIQGYVFATTVLVSSQTGPIQLWAVYKLSGFLSNDPGRSMQARYVMNHIMATWTTNKSWDEAYKRKIKDVTGRTLAMQNALVAQIQRNAARSASNDLARLNHPNQGVNVRPGERKSSSVNTILGTKEVCDALGRCKNVSNDYDTYYMDHSGNVSPAQPGGAPPDNSGVWSPMYTQ
jgi:hypothetical protein